MIKEFSSHSYLRHGANVKLHNGGMLGVGRCRNVSGILNSSLQQLRNGSFLSVLLFTFSALKEPAKELKFIIIYVRWEMCEQNISTIFRVWERCSVTELNVRIMWTIGRNYPCIKTFSSSTPLSSGFPESLTPSPPPVRISRIPSVGGLVDKFFSRTTHYICSILFILIIC